MSDPKVIYLGPACQKDGDGREWCEDDVWPDCECGCPSVRYMLESDAQSQLAALREELAKYQALSVTNILLDVVPGKDGEGYEVFATSVEHACEKLGELSLENETLKQRLADTKRKHLRSCQIAIGKSQLAKERHMELIDLREDLAKYKDGFFQKVTDEDLKKISDFVGDGDLPTQSFFMRQDAANLANMTMHMVREVQSMRLRLADAERRNAECMALLAETSKSILRHQAEQPMSNRLAGLLTKARAKVDRYLKAALNPNPEAASHE